MPDFHVQSLNMYELARTTYFRAGHESSSQFNGDFLSPAQFRFSPMNADGSPVVVAPNPYKAGDSTCGSVVTLNSPRASYSI